MNKYFSLLLITLCYSLTLVTNTRAATDDTTSESGQWVFGFHETTTRRIETITAEMGPLSILDALRTGAVSAFRLQPDSNSNSDSDSDSDSDSGPLASSIIDELCQYFATVTLTLEPCSSNPDVTFSVKDGFALTKQGSNVFDEIRVSRPFWLKIIIRGIKIRIDDFEYSEDKDEDEDEDEPYRLTGIDASGNRVEVTDPFSKSLIECLFIPDGDDRFNTRMGACHLLSGIGQRDRERDEWAPSE